MNELMTTTQATDRGMAPNSIEPPPLLSRGLPLLAPHPARHEATTPTSSDGPLALDYQAQPCGPDLNLPRMDVTFTYRKVSYDGTLYYYYMHDDC